MDVRSGGSQSDFRASACKRYDERRTDWRCAMRPCFRSNYGRVESFAKKRRQDLELSSGPLSRWLCIAISGLASVGGCEHVTRQLLSKALAEFARRATTSACSDTRSACRSRGTLRRKSWIAPLDAVRRSRLVFKAAADCGVKADLLFDNR